MPRVCTICTHEEREAIDRAVVSGGSNRAIARRWGVSKDAVARHQAEHLPAAIVKAQEEVDVRNAIDIVKQLRTINGATLRILKRAHDAGDSDTALKAIDRVQKQIELQAKLLGDLEPDGVTVNVLVSPEWQQLRSLILQALDAHPAARLSVAAALLSAESHARH